MNDYLRITLNIYLLCKLFSFILYIIYLFRFFPTVGTYQNHIQLHQANSITPQKLLFTESTMSKISKMTERSREVKREEHFYENVKSLTCPTCGKV